MTNRLRRLWRRYRKTGGLVYELMTALLCLAVGLLAMPCLIFIAGRIALGPYAPGGVFTLGRSFVANLAAGSQASWFIVLGPYFFVMFFRFGRRLLHN